MKRQPYRTHRVQTAAMMVRQHGVTPEQAAACLEVSPAEVRVALSYVT